MQNKIFDTVYICDWLPPDFGAVGQYGFIFAKEMADSGQKVVLLGLTSGESSTQVLTGAVEGSELCIVKIRASAPDKINFSRRLIWTIITNTRLLFNSWAFVRRSKRVVITGSPPLFLHWIMASRPLHRTKVVYRITDFHPECSIAERGRPSSLLSLLLALTIFWRRRVDHIEVLGHDQARRLHAIGINPQRITLKRDPSPVMISAATDPLPRPAFYQGKKFILYSGNWGLAHDVDTFIEGYARHHLNGSGQVVLWLNAVGGNADRVEKILRSKNLPVYRSRPVAIDLLPSLLLTPDAHLITLSDAFVGYVLPSKVYGCVASGKPTLFIGSTLSDVHLVASEGLGNAYIRADVGSYEDVTTFLEDIANGAMPILNSSFQSRASENFESLNVVQN